MKPIEKMNLIIFTSLIIFKPLYTAELPKNYIMADMATIKALEIANYEFAELQKTHNAQCEQIINKTVKDSRTRLTYHQLLAFAPYLRGTIIQRDLTNICNSKWLCHNLRSRLEKIEKQNFKVVKDFKYPADAGVQTECGHFFHEGHLNECLEKMGNSCPICKTPISKKRKIEDGSGQGICAICQEEI
jgi:hypothetical protein